MASSCGAEDEAAARALAQSQAGNEGLGIYRGLGLEEDQVARRLARRILDGL